MINSDALAALKNMDTGSVDCVVTSPPYWKVRNYLVHGQIGQEQELSEYIGRLVEVFREVRRVLTDRGTCWINMGDTRAGNSAVKRRQSGAIKLKQKDLVGVPWRLAIALQDDGWFLRQDIIWHKPNPMPESIYDRCTTAHEYIFLLTKSAHYDFFWRNIAEPVAEQSLDRYDRGRSNSHKYANGGEHKGSAVRSPGPRGARQPRVPGNWHTGSRAAGSDPTGYAAAKTKAGTEPVDVRGRLRFYADHQAAGRLIRNKRSVWEFANGGTGEKHYATYPLALPETCILAGCRPTGKRCDCSEVIATPLGSAGSKDPSAIVGRAGFERVRPPGAGSREMTRGEQRDYARQLRAHPARRWLAEAIGKDTFDHYVRGDRAGARPVPPDVLDLLLLYGIVRRARIGCDCPTAPAGIVLDPFHGTGTTGLAAIKHGFGYIGIELKPEYVEISDRRARAAFPLIYTALTAEENREPEPKDLHAQETDPPAARCAAAG